MGFGLLASCDVFLSSVGRLPCLLCRGDNGCARCHDGHLSSQVVGIQLEVYVDPDYARKGTNRRSASGGVVMCAGACVPFLSRTPTSGTCGNGELEIDHVRSVW